MAIALDTLAYARRLREAGFSEQQAEGSAEALAAAMTVTFATKQDLRELEARIDARFATVDMRFENLERHLDELEKRMELRMDDRLADLERRMTMRLGGIMTAGIAVFATIVKLA